MSTPINQIRSRMTTPGAGQLGASMVYDPSPPAPLHDPTQLGNTFPAPPQMPSSDNSGMLEDILREMESSSMSDSPGPDTNVGLMNYAINPVNIPPPMSSQAQMQLHAETTRAAEHMANLDEGIADSGANSSLFLAGGDITGSALGQKILNSIKPLVTVFVIVLILSLHQTNRFLFSFFPQLLLENGQLSIYAILLRCTIAVILFYLTSLIL